MKFFEKKNNFKENNNQPLCVSHVIKQFRPNFLRFFHMKNKKAAPSGACVKKLR